MNLLDLLIAVLAVSAAGAGYRLGFLARAASWVGGGLGLYLGARFLPDLLAVLEGSSPFVVLAAAVVVVLGAAAIGQGLGLAVGSQLRRAVPHPARPVDRFAGAGVGVIGTLVVVWLLMPALGEVPGSVSRLARTSAVVGVIDDVAPSPPDSLEALRRLVGRTPFPEVFVGMRPAPVTGPPPTSLALSPELQGRVAASTVNVEARACGRIQEGSGFVAGSDLIVTNAHVVAGAEGIRVRVPGGGLVEASLVVFDDDRDLALLSAPGLGRPALALGGAQPGDEGAIFGHPGGQDQLRIAPAAVREQIDAVGRDIYGDDRVQREVYVLAARLQQGDSGAALVDPSGAAVGVAFAIAPDRSGTAYALTADEVRAVLAVPRGGAVSSGPCL